MMASLCVANCSWRAFKLSCWGWMSWDIFKSLCWSSGIWRWLDVTLLSLSVERGCWVIPESTDGKVTPDGCLNEGVKDEKPVCWEDRFSWVWGLNWKLSFSGSTHSWCSCELSCRGNVGCEALTSRSWNPGILKWLKGSVLSLLTDRDSWDISHSVPWDGEDKAPVCWE